MNVDVDNDHLDGLSISEHAKSIVKISIKNKRNHYKTYFNVCIMHFYVFENFGLAINKCWYAILPDEKKFVTCASGKYRVQLLRIIDI